MDSPTLLLAKIKAEKDSIVNIGQIKLPHDTARTLKAASRVAGVMRNQLVEQILIQWAEAWIKEIPEAEGGSI